MIAQQPLIEITIVSSNAQLLGDCLASIVADPPANGRLRIRALWNGPGRDRGPLPPDLRTRFPEVEWEEAAVSGYARSQNLLLGNTTGDFVFVLNDDVLIRPGAIANLTTFMAAAGNERIGVVSPRILNPDGTLQPNTFAFPSLPRVLLWASGLRALLLPLSNYGEQLGWRGRLASRLGPLLRVGAGRSRFWAHDRVLDIETFGGAAMFVRGTALREIGLMDDVSLGGVEEVEWHYRFHQAGWRVVFFPGAEMVHLGGVTQNTNPWWPAEYTKGYLNFFRKHRSRASYVALRTVGAVTFLGPAFVFAISRQSTRSRVMLRCALILARGR